MEEELKKAADRNADALNEKVGQQARNAPVDPHVDDGPKRRTWEGYADDYRALSEKLVDASRMQQEARTQIEELEAQLDAKDANLKRIKAQRLKDLDRLAAVSRTRDLLEKRSAAQMAKVAAAHARAAAAPAVAAFIPAEIAAARAAEPDTPPIGEVLALEMPDKSMPEVREVPPANCADEGQRPLGAASSFFTWLSQHDERSLGWSERRWWRQTIKAAQKAHKEQRLGLARQLFEAALHTKATASLWEQLGHVLRESGHFLDGEAAYRHALALKPDRAELMFLSGYCLEMAGQFGEAASLYDAALVTDPMLAGRYAHLRDFRTRFGH